MRESGSAQAHCRFLLRLKNFIFDAENESRISPPFVCCHECENKFIDLEYSVEELAFCLVTDTVPAILVSQPVKMSLAYINKPYLIHTAFRGSLTAHAAQKPVVRDIKQGLMDVSVKKTTVSTRF